MTRRPPLALAVPAGLGVMFLALPLVGLVQRAPWAAVGHQLASHEVRQALRLSLVTSLAATALAAVLGVPLAWVLARVSFRGRALVRALALLPRVRAPDVQELS